MALELEQQTPNTILSAYQKRRHKERAEYWYKAIDGLQIE